MTMRLVNLDTNETLAEEVLYAQSFITRLKGLMFTNRLQPDTCLYIKPCRSIHTFFMRYAIDVLHLDAQHRIVGIENGIPPGKIGAVFKDTVSVIELAAGSIERTETKIGQAVQII